MSKNSQSEIITQSAGKETRLFKPPTGGKIGVALVFPNEYAVGMASLGYQAVWRILNSIPDVYCERAFAPAGLSNAPRTVESNRPIGNFDVIAFSLSFELDAIGIVWALREAGVPLEARKRRDEQPLVIIGGVVPTLNPEPIAEFADIVVIGEGEEVLPELFSRLLELRGTERTKILTEVASVSGVYVPRFYRVEYGPGRDIKSRSGVRQRMPASIMRRWVKDLDQYPTHSVFVAPDAQFGEMGLLEISRGCGRGCRFCAAGFIYRPPRVRSLKALEPSLDFLLKHWKRIGLVASSGTDHPQAQGIVEAIRSRGGEASFASIRVENLTDKILDVIAPSSRTLTLAPEAGSERLRKVIGKSTSEDEFLDAAESIGIHGIKAIKLYFLVGLPTETYEDVMAIAEFAARIASVHRGKKRSGRVSISVSPFVPKSHTPFGLHPMEKPDVISARIDALRTILRKTGGIEAKFESVNESIFQAAISRGDRRAAELIKRAAEPQGSIRRALKDPPPWLNDILYAPRFIDEPLPWDFIDAHIGKDYLYSEYQQGLTGRKATLCRPDKCHSCDACR